MISDLPCGIPPVADPPQAEFHRVRLKIEATYFPYCEVLKSKICIVYLC